MMKKLALTLSALTALSAAAAPVVSDVTMSQDAGRTVTIDYVLSGEPGIVTVDIQTNGVSIGETHLTHFAGDVNRLVEPGNRSVSWKPRKAWPGHLVDSGARAVVTAWATNAPPDVMTVSLVVPKTVRYYASLGSVPGGVSNDLYKTDVLLLRKCPAANVRWRMGSPTTPAESGREAAREVPHYVTLNADFYMGVYLVTQRQYERVMGTKPSGFKSDADSPLRPVEQVSWEDLRGTAASGHSWPENKHDVADESFFGVLRAYAGLNGLDLPTEAQWEFACRAGVGSALYTGEELDGTDTSTRVDALAWYKGTANGKTHPVGLKPANPWGFYDFYGNVWDWCLDWYADSIAGVDPNVGPSANADGYRIRRGGSYGDVSARCRSAFRLRDKQTTRHASIGFRVWCAVMPY